MNYADRFADYYDVPRIQEMVDSGEEVIIIDTYRGFKQNMGIDNADNIEAGEAMDEIADAFDLPFLSVSQYDDLVIDMYDY